MTDPCLVGEAKLAQSVKTQSFDISTSYGDSWTSVSGSPLDLYVFNKSTISIIIPVFVYNYSQIFLFDCFSFPFHSYFIDLNNDKTLANQCDSFENGVCDDNFNSMNYRYDGGVSLRRTNFITRLFCYFFHEVFLLHQICILFIYSN